MPENVGVDCRGQPNKKESDNHTNFVAICRFIQGVIDLTRSACTWIFDLLGKSVKSTSDQALVVFVLFLKRKDENIE